MNLSELYEGRNLPFEGDRTILLRGLPAGAVAQRAVCTVIPAAPPSSTLFNETIRFDDEGIGRLGGTLARVETADTANAAHSVISFHARRTVTSVNIAVDTVKRVTVQIDIGGVWVQVADDGGPITQGKAELALTVAPAASTVTFPPLTTERIQFTAAKPIVNGNGAPVPEITINEVGIRSAPTNVSVRLEDMPPFFNRVGELVTPESSGDFAEVLNAFLLDTPAEGDFHALPFVLHTDSLARLNLLVEIDFVIEQSVLPADVPEQTLTFGFGSLPGDFTSIQRAIETDSAALPRVSLPVGAVPQSISTRITGTFEPTRVAMGEIGDIGDLDARHYVSGKQSLAQPLESHRDIDAVAIDLLVASENRESTAMNLSIQDDLDGKPSGNILTSAEFTVDKRLPDDSTWVSVPLAEPFRIEKARGDRPGNGVNRYWLVMQSRASADQKVLWAAKKVSPADGNSPTPSLQSSADGGRSWRAIAVTSGNGDGIVGAVFRIRDQPPQFRVPVRLQVGTDSQPQASAAANGSEAQARPSNLRRFSEKFDGLGRVDFEFNFIDALQAGLTPPTSRNGEVEFQDVDAVGIGPLFPAILGEGEELELRGDLDGTQPHTLRVAARLVDPPDDRPGAGIAALGSRLELRWRSRDRFVGDVQIFPLAGDAFPTQAVSVTPPADAVETRVTVVNPDGGGSLRIESLSLSATRFISTPLVFQAEAPGELTILNARFTYELPTNGQVRGSNQPPSLRAMSGISNRVVALLSGGSEPIDTIETLLDFDPNNDPLPDGVPIELVDQLKDTAGRIRASAKEVTTLLLAESPESRPKKKCATAPSESAITDETTLTQLLSMSPDQLADAVRSAEKAKAVQNKVKAVQAALLNLQRLLEPSEFKRLDLAELSETYAKL